MTSEQTLLTGQAAQFVFRAPEGSVVTLGGIDGAALRELVDQVEHIPDDRRALFARLRPAGSVEAYVDQVIAILAETAVRLWPVWFTDVSFAMCCDDALGRQAAAVIANLIDAEGEDQFRELIDGTLRLLEKHYDLPDDIDSEVQHDPDQKRPSLHGRLSFTFLSEGSREQHYCFRLLGHTNARAFQGGGVAWNSVDRARSQQ